MHTIIALLLVLYWCCCMVVCVLMMTDSKEDDLIFHPTWYDKIITIIMSPIIIGWFCYKTLSDD